MNYLQKQIHFTASIRWKLLIGFILCIYLNFIIIFLQPFDTSQFVADYKNLFLSGYGFLAFVVYVIQGCIENIWYTKAGKVWTVTYEIIVILLFCLFTGTVLYMYNMTVINEDGYTIDTYWTFLNTTILYMTPVILPPILYLRQKFGERIIPPPVNSIVLTGENKNETLKLQKDQLLFIKAVENYVEICFIDKNNKAVSKTFRQTLSNVCEQLPFLQKCHRSYLVNTNTIKEIIGNSQGAKISFTISEKEIPLSKTYYKDIKNKVF